MKFYYKKSMENYNSREIFCSLILYFIYDMTEEQNIINSVVSKVPLLNKRIFNYMIKVLLTFEDKLIFL